MQNDIFDFDSISGFAYRDFLQAVNARIEMRDYWALETIRDYVEAFFYEVPRDWIPQLTDVQKKYILNKVQVGLHYCLPGFVHIWQMPLDRWFNTTPYVRERWYLKSLRPGRRQIREMTKFLKFLRYVQRKKDKNGKPYEAFHHRAKYSAGDCVIILKDKYNIDFNRSWRC